MVLAKQLLLTLQQGEGGGTFKHGISHWITSQFTANTSDCTARLYQDYTQISLSDNVVPQTTVGLVVNTKITTRNHLRQQFACVNTV